MPAGTDVTAEVARGKGADDGSPLARIPGPRVSEGDGQNGLCHLTHSSYAPGLRADAKHPDVCARG